jgi:hypothetical protein
LKIDALEKQPQELKSGWRIQNGLRACGTSFCLPHPHPVISQYSQNSSNNIFWYPCAIGFLLFQVETSPHESRFFLAPPSSSPLASARPSRCPRHAHFFGLGGHLRKAAQHSCRRLLLWLWAVKDFSRLQQNVRYAETYFAARSDYLRETPCQRACGNSRCGAAPASPLAFRAGQQWKSSQ